MSETLLLTVLSISELALIATGLAVFLFIRNRRLARERVTADSETDNPAPPPDPQLQFADYLRQNLDQTQEKLSSLPPEQARLLEGRLGFLQSEINAQQHVDDPQSYWQELLKGLNSVLPAPQPEQVEPISEEQQAPTLNELDDIDIDDPLDNIPTLEDNLDSGVTKDPSLTIETANDDMERLRKIINRQHETMDGLKQSLQEKDIDLQNHQELSKKLEEVEVAQAQLTMCVETLEKENDRLNELIKEYGESGGSQEELVAAKQELEEANERIHTLEKENSQQAHRISELESEIAELEKILEQRNRQLAQAQHEESDLSQLDDNEEHSQDSLMKEIETLTELITQKSEELSRLQSESVDDFEFDSPMPDTSGKETGT